MLLLIPVLIQTMAIITDPRYRRSKDPDLALSNILGPDIIMAQVAAQAIKISIILAASWS